MRKWEADEESCRLSRIVRLLESAWILSSELVDDGNREAVSKALTRCIDQVESEADWWDEQNSIP